MSRDEQTVLYDVVDERIGVVTLNRPDKANSQTPAMLDELNDVMMGPPPTGRSRSSCCRPTGSTSRPATTSPARDAARRTPSTSRSRGSPASTSGRPSATSATPGRGATSASRRSPRCRVSASPAACCCAGRWTSSSPPTTPSSPTRSCGWASAASSTTATRGSSARARPRNGCSPPASSPPAEAEKFGMVNHVVPLDDLREFTMTMAGRIAEMNPFALGAGQAGGQPDPGRAGLLRRDPVGVRHPLDRSRPRPVGQRLSDPGRPRPDEAIDEGRLMTAAATPLAATPIAATPLAEGLFTWPSDSPALIGTRCGSMRRGHVPEPLRLPAVRVRGHGADRTRARTGTVWTWTTQNFRPPPPYAGPEEFVPYHVGYVELARRGDRRVVPHGLRRRPPGDRRRGRADRHPVLDERRRRRRS